MTSPLSEETIGVSVRIGVRVEVRGVVRVWVGVAVAKWLPLGVEVGVLVGIILGVRVRDGVQLCVEVGGGVRVRDGVGKGTGEVGQPRTNEPAQATTAPIATSPLPFESAAGQSARVVDPRKIKAHLKTSIIGTLSLSSHSPSQDGWASATGATARSTHEAAGPGAERCTDLPP